MVFSLPERSNLSRRVSEILPSHWRPPIYNAYFIDSVKPHTTPYRSWKQLPNRQRYSKPVLKYETHNTLHIVPPYLELGK